MFLVAFGMTGEVINFGCRLNGFESEAMAELIDDDRMVVINSCAVTSEASRQVRQTIRKLRRERPEARIVVTGCGADIETAEYEAMEEVNAVLLNGSKFQPELAKKDGVVGHMARDHGAIHDGPMARQAHARAHLEVQNGCNHSCTFCIIPTGRGAARSVPPRQVVAKVKKLVALGHGEVVLTGVDLTSYGEDIGPHMRLGHLVAAILEDVPELPRLRLSSIDAIELDDLLFELVTKEPRIMPHLHLSLQSGDNMILKRMKRRHQRNEAIDLCQMLKAARPSIALGADLIAGFPTETEEMFANTLALVDECALDLLHVFPFSPRHGTPAAKMPQLHGSVVKERAARLRALATIRSQKFHEGLVGGAGHAIVEKDGEARLENFARVVFEGDAKRGEIMKLAITDAAHDHVKGILL